jgi:hypothetical protein
MSLPGEPVARESREEKEDAELAAALETYLEGADAGRPPASEELARAHPAVAHRIRACLDALRAVEDACGARPGPDAEHRSPESNPEAEDPGGEKRLGDHRILREIGRGGMGIVFEAEQVSLRRRVAVKSCHSPARSIRSSSNDSRTRPRARRSSTTRTSCRSTP